MGVEGIMVDCLEDVGLVFKCVIDMQMNEGKMMIIEIMCMCEFGDLFCCDVLLKLVCMFDKYKDYV